MNYIKITKEQVETLIENAYKKVVEASLLPEGAELRGIVEIPKDDSNGDFAANHAMSCAKALRMAPKRIAEILAENINLEGSYFQSVEVAGPGFLNFHLGGTWYKDILIGIEAEKADFGKTDDLKGQKIMVEFVSANPTGPMHIGNARGGVLGDCLAETLAWAGADVWREFYVNDAGNQIEKFALSIDLRYQQLIYGEENVPFPEDCYQGEDIKELAKAFYDEYGDRYLSEDEKVRREAMAQFGLAKNLPQMKKDLEKYKVHYDEWFCESTLHSSGYVGETVQELTKRGYTYEQDGALWLKTSLLLADALRKHGKSEEQIEKLGLKDDVLRRSNGIYTYFAADIAYHRNKLEKRGFDKVIDIWGADHHGHVARTKAAMDALGLDGENRLDVVLMQLVRLMRDGEIVRMSKRTGKTITLSVLLDEIPVDAARYFFNAKSDTQMDFDLGLAVRQDSENPVYYVQYAHARICTLIANLAADAITVPKAADTDISLLSDPAERTIIKLLALLPEEIRIAARDYNPSRLNNYATELAGAFHRFYNACRIKGADEGIAKARLLLCACVRQAISNALAISGVKAPEKM